MTRRCGHFDELVVCAYFTSTFDSSGSQIDTKLAFDYLAILPNIVKSLSELVKSVEMVWVHLNQPMLLSLMTAQVLSKKVKETNKHRAG